ncbi:cation diffusion facilitator family transporter [Bdellovibrio sp. HCB337]|uniref:cation diffusion facilitator family transporter n=1 Tax=Bdellovibrio sp. HCB337 TaxID=3394358 RepID=UPI0039A50568
MELTPAVTGDTARNKAAWISLLASVFVFAMKFAAYYMTGSTAVLSDALESTVNVLAAIVALIVIRIASKPADEDHPYGHGKVEYFSAAFEGGLIFFAALMIIREAIVSLLAGGAPRQLEIGVLVIGIAAIFNLLLGIYLKRTGQKQQSEALKASGAHVISDVWTTVGVIVGLMLLLATGLTWIDPVIAIIVGLNLAYEGYKIVRKSGGGLVDEVDTEVLSDLSQALQKNRVSGVIDIHQLRIIRSGRFHHVDAHLVIPEYWNISHAHNVCDDFESSVVRDYTFDGEIAFHLDPCKRAYCRNCKMEDCPIRRHAFENQKPFTVESLTGGPKVAENIEM